MSIGTSTSVAPAISGCSAGSGAAVSAEPPARAWRASDGRRRRSPRGPSRLRPRSNPARRSAGAARRPRRGSRRAYSAGGASRSAGGRARPARGETPREPVSRGEPKECPSPRAERRPAPALAWDRPTPRGCSRRTRSGADRRPRAARFPPARPGRGRPGGRPSRRRAAARGCPLAEASRGGARGPARGRRGRGPVPVLDRERLEDELRDGLRGCPRHRPPSPRSPRRRGSCAGSCRSLRISIGSAFGRSRLLYCSTTGISSGSISLASRFCRMFSKLSRLASSIASWLSHTKTTASAPFSTMRRVAL